MKEISVRQPAMATVDLTPSRGAPLDQIFAGYLVSSSI
jgi:hypothetical protein